LIFRTFDGDEIDLELKDIRYGVEVRQGNLAWGMTRTKCLKGDVMYYRPTSDAQFCVRIYPVPTLVPAAPDSDLTRAFRVFRGGAA
jgi:hypothetical protein